MRAVSCQSLFNVCFHPKNVSDSTEKLRLGLPGGLWKGASAQLQIATSTLKKTHKLAEKWKHLCISLDTEWEPVHSFPPPVLPAHRWFGGWDQKDVWLTIWCCFTGWGHTAGIGILSPWNIVEWSYSPGLSNLIWLVGFSFFKIKSSNYNCNFVTNSWMEVSADERETGLSPGSCWWVCPSSVHVRVVSPSSEPH